MLILLLQKTFDLIASPKVNLIFKHESYPSRKLEEIRSEKWHKYEKSKTAISLIPPHYRNTYFKTWRNLLTSKG